MSKSKILIDPVTRIEGYGRVEISLDETGQVRHAYFTIPELRGFESFCVGRPAEEMPNITSRICGVCPTAHHLASTKALDDLFGVEPPVSARLIRELIYMAFIIEDHLLHLFYLAGPDILLAKTQDSSQDILGLAKLLGKERVYHLVQVRKELRGIIGLLGGGPIHPTFGVPGGVLRPLKEDEKREIKRILDNTLNFMVEIFDLFKGPILDFIQTGPKPKTHYMGLVDEEGALSLYDGRIRVVSPEGEEFASFHPKDYTDYLDEKVVEWTYNRLTFLRNGEIFRVGPLARLNVADRLPTPLAQAQYEEMIHTLGEKPVHSTYAYHWARLIEALYAAERMEEILEDPELTTSKVRVFEFKTPVSGTGVVEAPRGTLIHIYQTDQEGILTKVSLLVATQLNAASISRDLEDKARDIIKKEKMDEDSLSKELEPIIRAYNPCLSCATHTIRILDFRS